ncbi:MAG TPA: hypothetical protein VGM14_17575 [Streptosporangiaceae bacterium]
MATARSSQVGAGAVFVVALVVAALALSNSHNHPPAPEVGSGCLASSTDYNVPLTTGQAGIAATIAGVASRRRLPARAVTIAYATALQESDLENLPYGDRDSVGIFQQRPSQGWGTRAELLNPIYATTRFFEALVAIPGYQKLAIYQAAQDVQHSADGSAYSQYAGQGQVMAAGFAGWQGRSVYCWYGDTVANDDGASHKGPAARNRRLASAKHDLKAAYGHLLTGHVGDPIMTVRVRDHAIGWSVATWLVTHADNYRISEVRFAGYRWTAANGHRGWVKARPSRHWPSARLTVAFG